MSLVTVNVWERVLRIEAAGAIGTGTAIEHDGKTYCVTARHVLPPAAGATIELSNRYVVYEVEPEPIDGIPDAVDIAVFEIPDEFSREKYPLPMGAQALSLSQDVFFLGYPYGEFLRGSGMDRAPFVKKAALSSSSMVDGVQIWYLDGINNPGFSGGPAVAAPSGKPGFQFFGVVSGYRIDCQEISHEGVALDGFEASGNSGIVVTYGTTHVEDALAARG